MDEPKSYCFECSRYKEKNCSWNYMYADSDYAYDCMDWERDEMFFPINPNSMIEVKENNESNPT